MATNRLCRVVCGFSVSGGVPVSAEFGEGKIDAPGGNPSLRVKLGFLCFRKDCSGVRKGVGPPYLSIEVRGEPMYNKPRKLAVEGVITSSPNTTDVGVASLWPRVTVLLQSVGVTLRIVPLAQILGLRYRTLV